MVSYVLSAVAVGLRRWLEWLVAHCSLVEDRPFFDPARFSWAAALEANWAAIRAELDEVLRFRDELPNFQDLSPEQAALTTNDGWKTFFFCAYGHRAEANRKRCPHTARVVDSIPGLSTAFFSVLGPHVRLPPHRGPYKGVLRCHLALKVPDPTDASGITVGGQTVHWQEGKCLIFDDTFPHEAWNDTDLDRAVLFLDIVRPLRPPASWLNVVLIGLIGLSPPLLKWKRRHRNWERGPRGRHRTSQTTARPRSIDWSVEKCLERVARRYDRRVSTAPSGREGVVMNRVPPCPFPCQLAGPGCLPCRVFGALHRERPAGPQRHVVNLRSAQAQFQATIEQGAETRRERLARLLQEQQKLRLELVGLAAELRDTQHGHGGFATDTARESRGGVPVS